MSDDEIIPRKKVTSFSALNDDSSEDTNDSSGSDGEKISSPVKNNKSGFAALKEDSDDDNDDNGPSEDVSLTVQNTTTTSNSQGGNKGGAKNSKKGSGKTTKDEEDDWEALLDAEISKNTAASPGTAAASTGKGGNKNTGKGNKNQPNATTKSSTTTDTPPSTTTDGGDQDNDGDDDATTPGTSGATGGKKKKKKGGANATATPSGSTPTAVTPTTTAPPPENKKLSAAARLALDRQAKIREEEEKRQRVIDEENRRIDEENRRLEEEQKRKEDAKARRAADRKAKKEAEIKAGTYRTKKQKEEITKALARLDAMKAAGMKIDGFEAKRAEMMKELTSSTADDDEPATTTATASSTTTTTAAPTQPVKIKSAAMYGKKRDRKDDNGTNTKDTTTSETHAVLPTVDDWEDGADNWEELANNSTATVPASTPGPVAVVTSTTSTPTASTVTATAEPLSSRTVQASTTSQSNIGNSSKSLEERIEESRLRREARKKAAIESRSADRLRSPICVVLGHVDTGKTSLLDKIRRTNVQEGEAGGITQQIGATYFPMERIRTATDKLNKDLNLEYRIPGLLIIDTPGHEQFTNLRSRGSSLCDIAVLVVDIMHGLERQTIESINLLRSRKTPFVVALNKVDRMYGWKANPNSPIRDTLAKQPDYAVSEFETRTQKVLSQLAEQGLNAKLYYENDNFKKNVSVIPTSAVSGEGVPDLLMLIVQLTQQLMSHRLMFSPHVQATILEVKSIDGLGTTVDVVLVNGELHEGDTIVVCGMSGPIVTPIRALLTPPPLREMRVKSDYVHHKSIEAAMGVKIVGSDLDKAVAGTEVLVLHPDDEIEDLKEEVMEDFEKIMKGFKRDPVGVYVQASTLGSLEALLEYLRNHDPVVPVSGVNIGPLHKRDVVVASTMLEHKKEFATILAFDVKVTPEATEFAEKLGVRIFTADIIYHLTDQFDAYLKDTLSKKQAAQLADAVFPVIAKIIPTAIFNAKDPILCGVDVIEGKLKIGTPLCVILPDDKVVKAGGINSDASSSNVQVKKGPNVLQIGRVGGIEVDHTAKQEASPGTAVALKIEPANDAQRAIIYGRHFDHQQLLYANISRQSIDILKENFRDQMSKDNWKTVIKLKELLKIE